MAKGICRKKEQAHMFNDDHYCLNWRSLPETDADLLREATELLKGAVGVVPTRLRLFVEIESFLKRSGGGNG